MTIIQVNPTVSLPEWEVYVKNHPDGLIYHLPAWKQVIEESFHFKPYYLFALNDDGKLCGFLPLFYINSIITGNRLVSLPFTHICGPLADSETIIEELVNRAKELALSLKCKYLEIRMLKPSLPNLLVNDYFSTYILELAEPQVVWKKLHPKGVRWAINKAIKDGVTIRLENTTKGLNAFDGLNQQTKKKLGVPAHPSYFLKNIVDKLGEYTNIYLADAQGRTIAGLVALNYKDTVCYAYGASDAKYLNYHPNDLLIWQTIQECCNARYRYFDFGKTSPDDEGLVRFKKHWGTETKQLYYYYWPKIPKLISSNRNGVRYKVITGIWRRLPLALTKKISSFVFKHID